MITPTPKTTLRGGSLLFSIDLLITFVSLFHDGTRRGMTITKARNFTWITRQSIGEPNCRVHQIPVGAPRRYQTAFGWKVDYGEVHLCAGTSVRSNESIAAVFIPFQLKSSFSRSALAKDVAPKNEHGRPVWRYHLAAMANPQLIRPVPPGTPPELAVTRSHFRPLPYDLLKEASNRLGVLCLLAAALWVVATGLDHIAMRAMGADSNWNTLQVSD